MYNIHYLSLAIKFFLSIETYTPPIGALNKISLV